MNFIEQKNKNVGVIKLSILCLGKIKALVVNLPNKKSITSLTKRLDGVKVIKIDFFFLNHAFMGKQPFV